LWVATQPGFHELQVLSIKSALLIERQDVVRVDEFLFGDDLYPGMRLFVPPPACLPIQAGLSDYAPT
jgi:hypothetical protein